MPLPPHRWPPPPDASREEFEQWAKARHEAFERWAKKQERLLRFGWVCVWISFALLVVSAVMFCLHEASIIR